MFVCSLSEILTIRRLYEYSTSLFSHPTVHHDLSISSLVAPIFEGLEGLLTPKFFTSATVLTGAICGCVFFFRLLVKKNAEIRELQYQSNALRMEITEANLRVSFAEIATTQAQIDASDARIAVERIGNQMEALRRARLAHRSLEPRGQHPTQPRGAGSKRDESFSREPQR